MKLSASYPLSPSRASGSSSYSVAMRSAAVVVLCLLCFSPAFGSEVKAAPEIVDADTIWAGTTKIRLSGIDAPESDQICLDEVGKT